VNAFRRFKLQPLVQQFLAGPVERDGTDGHDDGRLAGLLHGCRVLLVLDRSVAPDVAVETLLARAQAASVDVVVVRVLPDWCPARLEAQIRASLDRVASRLTSTTQRVVADVRLGEPVEQILAAADEHAVGLIVLAVPRRGIRSAGDRPVIHVLRRSPVPVLMVQGGDWPAAATGGRARSEP
jgi:hypothetical protein